MVRTQAHALDPVRRHQITQALGEIHTAKIKLDVDTTHAVARARKLGLSWETIGDQLNISRQSAWERWRYLDDDTTADGQTIAQTCEG